MFPYYTKNLLGAKEIWLTHIFHILYHSKEGFDNSGLNYIKEYWNMYTLDIKTRNGKVRKMSYIQTFNERLHTIVYQV